MRPSTGAILITKFDMIFLQFLWILILLYEFLHIKNYSTHWRRVTHICVGNLTIIGSDNGLSPSHYLNQCWNIVNWTLRNKLQWNINRNSYIFIQENAFKNIIWKKAAILSRPRCVKMARDHSAFRKRIALHISLNPWTTAYIQNSSQYYVL